MFTQDFTFNWQKRFGFRILIPLDNSNSSLNIFASETKAISTISKQVLENFKRTLDYVLER